MPSDSAFDIISLELDYNNISDISALSGLSNLEFLVLSANNISDISTLSGLSNLEFLGLWENNISDISTLSGLTNLQTLVLYDNPLSQNVINVHIPQLEVRGVDVIKHYGEK